MGNLLKRFFDGNEKKTFYIQVEAVNLNHFIMDTHDLSTIRGGSFILLEAIRRLSEELKGQADTISKAASVGIFSFYGSNPQVEKLIQKIYTFLDKNTENHATFIVAIQENIEGNFPLVLETLQAKIRRDQWRLPTVAVPDFETTDQECYLDGWRPGMVPYTLDPAHENVKISRSTHFRREKGREIKHRLFYELLEDARYKDHLCAKDLGDLAIDSTKGNASGKIAFIHIDGNSFGRIRQQTCATPQQRSGFDQVIQEEFRKPFLKALLKKADSDPDFKTKDSENNDALRLEVLLWGGDEVIIVVPAWKGWDVLDLYYEKAQELGFEDIPLTHRAAMVFCHHNAPILQIRRLAEDLLDRTKLDIWCNANHLGIEKNAFLDHELGDAVHYLVLESFDMLKGSLDEFIESYYKNTSFRNLMINQIEFSEISADLQFLRGQIPRNKIFQIVQVLQTQNPDDEMNPVVADVNKIVDEILALQPKETRAEVNHHIQNLTFKSIDRWYLLGDLWDYIPHWEVK